MMSRFYLRFATLPLALFTAALLLIRAQPYENPQLRAQLLPDGCPAPCFMGVRPGVTTGDEAVKILQENRWVKSLSRDTDCVGCKVDLYTIGWSDDAPAWIDHEQPSWMTLYKSGVVYGFSIIPVAKIQLFDVDLADFGPVEIDLIDTLSARHSDVAGPPATVLTVHQYSMSFMALQKSSACLHYSRDLWALPITSIVMGHATDNWLGENFPSLLARLKTPHCREAKRSD